jgi:hypothetical protein
MLKREPVKYIRDGMKSRYKQREPCYICCSTEKIELHHLYCVSELWDEWSLRNRVVINTPEEIILHRQQFELDCAEKLDNSNLYSLCKTHHSRLHQLFGKSYSNYTALKVKEWLERQKARYGENLDGEGTDRLVSGQTEA